MSLPAYSQRHLDPAEAAAYRTKFQKTWIRRLSTRRETKLVLRALDDALAWHAAHGGPRASEARLLDLPCGAGRFAPLAAARVGAYVAGDHSPAMLDLTRAALAEAGLAERLVGTVTCDARHIDLPDAHVDTALCIRLLHHFPDRDDRVQILKELHRVTRGPLVTTFLDATSAKQRRHKARLARKGRTSGRVLVTPDEWRAEAAEAGWQTVHMASLSSQFSGQTVVRLVR